MKLVIFIDILLKEHCKQYHHININRMAAWGEKENVQHHWWKLSLGDEIWRLFPLVYMQFTCDSFKLKNYNKVIIFNQMLQCISIFYVNGKVLFRLELLFITPLIFSIQLLLWFQHNSYQWEADYMTFGITQTWWGGVRQILASSLGSSMTLGKLINLGLTDKGKNGYDDNYIKGLLWTLNKLMKASSLLSMKTVIQYRLATLITTALHSPNICWVNAQGQGRPPHLEEFKDLWRKLLSKFCSTSMPNSVNTAQQQLNE